MPTTTPPECGACPFLRVEQRSGFGGTAYYCNATGYWLGFQDRRPDWCLPVIQPTPEIEPTMAKKKPRSVLPVTKAKQMLQARGFICDLCERTAGPTIKHDLFGFADLIAVHPKLNSPTLAVQVTSGGRKAGGGHAAERITKILENPHALVCLQAGWRIEVWGIRRTIASDGRILDATSFRLSEDRESVITCEGSLSLLHLSEILTDGNEA